jgi:hypothetical protein
LGGLTEIKAARIPPTYTRLVDCSPAAGHTRRRTEGEDR